MGIFALWSFSVFLGVPQFAAAQEQANDGDYPAKLLTRGEVVSRVVDFYHLKKERRAFISDCLSHADDCFFVFAAMSDFDDIAFDPLSLYPDVTPLNRYYEAINVASMLGLVHGYLGDRSTPFRPEVVMTRIQALKLTLGASGLMHWKERFELGTIENTPFTDVDSTAEGSWWYPRYLNFALEKGILEPTPTFRPDEPITLAELESLMQSNADLVVQTDDQEIFQSGTAGA